MTVLITRRQIVKTTIKHGNKHVKRTVIRETTLYKRILKGVADRKGQARLRLRLTYRPSGSLPLQVRVAVSVGSRHANMTRTLRLRPAAHKPGRGR